MGDKILRVSVLANGDLLLGDRPATLPELGTAFEHAAGTNAVVWYYRENAAAQAPPIATDVMKLIAAARLPVRLSALADFSDADKHPLSEARFTKIREAAAQRKLVVLRPDGKMLSLPAQDRNAAPPQAVASVEKLLPSSVKRNVAAIGDTSWAMADSPSLHAAHQAIPYFGLLMGFAAIGHAVWIFDGAADALHAGCRNADVVIVDSARLPALPEAWNIAAARVMRLPQILVHERATFQLRKL